MSEQASLLSGHCLRLARAARAALDSPAAPDSASSAALLAELEQALASLAGASATACAAASSAAPAFALDLAGYLTDWNAGAEALFGYTRAQALGRHVLFLDAPEADDPGVAALFLEQADGVVEVLRRTRAGFTIAVTMGMSPLRDADGEVAGILVKVALAGPGRGAASARQRLHERLIDDSELGMLILDADARIVSSNAAFGRLSGYGPEELAGEAVERLLMDGEGDSFHGGLRAQINHALQRQGGWRGDLVGRHKSGAPFTQSVSISAVRAAAGSVPPFSHVLALFSDIDADADARLQRMASYDGVTGLPNRYLFHHLVEQVLSEARRATDYGAVLVIDVDTDGEGGAGQAGAELLADIASRCRAGLRDADILARLDGDRFGIALPSIEKREHAGLVARKLAAAIEQPGGAGALPSRVRARIGVAVYLEDSLDASELVRYAEVAAARVESGSADRFLFYSEEMDQRAKDRMRLENELRFALANGEFELHYQPKVSLRSGRMVGAEALLRWRHPQRGLISPDAFIPLAEETGLILDIGHWVLDEACRQLRAWQDAGLDMPAVAVNLSARQFDRRLPATIQAVLERHGVEAGMLSLEITESLLVGGADHIVAIMNALVAMGLALALDDFGTGYSSLAYLKKFPISTLKIDRAFVEGLPDDENDCAIARAIVTMAQQLRQEIVAEGVETPEQMAFLRALGCDQLQGWLFSPAVEAAQFAAMMAAGQRLDVGRLA